jgi:cardiolipin synthase
MQMHARTILHRWAAMKPEFACGNRLSLLVCGEQYFPSLESAITAAQREVFLETYIFEDDATGQRIAAALCAAARRGVAVQLLVDGFGSRNLPTALREALREAGVALLVYRPKISPLTLRRERLRRMHRKLAAIDGCVAFVGGINIIDDDSEQLPGPSYDYAVRIEGPLATDVRESMAHLWRRVARFYLGRRARMIPPAPACCLPQGDVAAALVVRDNLRHRTDIEKAYLSAIASARDEVLLACAYFLPGRHFRHVLIAAAQRGVRVVLLLQGQTDHPLQLYASRALYGSLLDAGVEIHEYRKGMLHAKVAVIDGRWATVGSSNLDPFSLLLAREANIVVEDPRFAAELRSSLQHAIAEGATPLASMHWQEQPWHQRARIWLAYGVVRMLMVVAGAGGEQ